jgi:hypothetical protein
MYIVCLKGEIYMRTKILGISKLNFVTNDGKTVTGTNLFIAFPDANVEGMRVDRVFVNQNISIPEIHPGVEADIFFNMRGKVEAVTLAK